MPTPQSLVRSYLQAVGDKDEPQLRALLSEDVTFEGPVMAMQGVENVLASFRGIAAVHERNDVQRVFVDGDEVCVIYDFVTDAVGRIPTIEWIRLREGRIAAIRLYYDQLPWQTLRQEIAKRASA